MIKKIGIFALALAVTALIAGCGGKPENNLEGTWAVEIEKTCDSMGKTITMQNSGFADPFHTNQLRQLRKEQLKEVLEQRLYEMTFKGSQFIFSSQENGVRSSAEPQGFKLENNVITITDGRTLVFEEEFLKGKFFQGFDFDFYFKKK
ncbi:MAG: hypothetical protein A3J83_09025 [Elusimicrobia bacterium RIFOXYA2_FULL_40_6]|nr:MAG: hypothetical protein A3J83_09025 [Elusimicrobia bacterium RIFOXYA2_FULL_40_6]